MTCMATIILPRQGAKVAKLAQPGSTRQLPCFNRREKLRAAHDVAPENGTACRYLMPRKKHTGHCCFTDGNFLQWGKAGETVS
jgi:hypothetical protein